MTQIGCFLDMKALRLTWSSFQLVSQMFFNTINFVNCTLISCQIHNLFSVFTVSLSLSWSVLTFYFELKLISTAKSMCFEKLFDLVSCDSTLKIISCQITYFFWVSLLCVDGKNVLFWQYVKNRLTGFCQIKAYHCGRITIILCMHHFTALGNCIHNYLSSLYIKCYDRLSALKTE